MMSGVTGTIPLDTVEALHNLGVTKPAAKNTAYRVSRITAAYTHTLAITRRRKERDKGV